MIIMEISPCIQKIAYAKPYSTFNFQNPMIPLLHVFSVQTD